MGAYLAYRRISVAKTMIKHAYDTIPPPAGLDPTSVCMRMPLIRKDRPESGPDPSEGSQRPSSVSHITRRKLSLSARPEAQAEEFQGRQFHGSPSLHSAPQDRQRTSAKNCLNRLIGTPYQRFRIMNIPASLTGACLILAWSRRLGLCLRQGSYVAASE